MLTKALSVLFNMLETVDSNEGRREAVCSLPVDDPEKQSAPKSRHLGHPKSLERERAPRDNRDKFCSHPFWDPQAAPFYSPS